jgi:hypothetical protein
MFNTHLAHALTLILALGSGCSSTDPATELPDDETELAYAAALAHQRSVSVTDVHLDPALAVLCEVNASFEIDETRDDSADVSFDELAACVNDGALQGRSLQLFAHAAQKSDSFTRYHGDSRIDSVREHLLDSGVLAADITIHAEGAVDERRVNIRVMPRHYR